MSAVREIEVRLGARGYSIRIGRGLLDDATLWRPLLRGRHALIVTNTSVAPLYQARLQPALADLHWRALALPDGEAHKTLASVARIWDALAELGATRDACILALGGGVVGDMAGFAAACWMRGIDCVQMPTTLLAMVDSAVGGKTGVDHAAGKNLIGAFHQPRLVLADLATLDTLPPREYRAGLAEIVKIGALGDAAFLAQLEHDPMALNAREDAALTHAIAHACAYKAGVVMRDETEQGERALLNFGHSFAHALETVTGYSTLLHGEAVAIGMVLAARLSARLGHAPMADAQRLAALLHALDLPTQPPPGLDADALLAAMRLDKKNRAGTLRLILWRGAGQAFIAADVDADHVRASWVRNA
ncbi:3-dehydroquinate synthase [Metallibacterium scheffleri]|uniref:3-dehydroquinate synthase n=1 Tax=Metallibacterium scheffleri TaxID=993689 RepID=A0A4S3KLY7_9GAMM|nr:3-dehydroquinate synthase [Metallibacterium scheffleri]THD09816.1 3-dehydroquinate synthase [Metallibacterium scheffleri]